MYPQVAPQRGYARYLYRRRGTFHFRIKIPQDLLQAIPSPELIKSLKTKDRKLAQTEVNPYVQETQEVFTLLRIGVLSPTQAQERLYTILQRKTASELLLRLWKSLLL
ncbi:DUF6538 domain-containing protein [Geomesophilobacter sediminis]|uniref:DUF6538 domain-containing protein n=1 Tax=Geomesophilobacter sediminis TaxID=2798584 RepID=UPI0038B266D1